MSKFVFGIDLGTTYSCIAYVDENGIPTVIKNNEGTNTTPSVVNFASSGEVVVGGVAKDSAVIEPNNSVEFVKRLMGKTDFAINYDGEDKSPEEISSYILRKLAKDASEQLDTEVKDVVITCPAYFGLAERKATKNAGEMAGLNVLEVISEPTAAALYYGCTKASDEKTFLVYDLGGGTFDVTIMRISSEKIEIICSEGEHELGGKDWDEAVMRHLTSEFCKETGFKGDFDVYAQQDLRLKAEKAKQQLTSREKVPVMIDATGKKGKVTVSRECFDNITESLLRQTIEKTDETIKIAEEKGYHVDEILLVGGSTRMPQVKKILHETYNIEPKILDPDEAVAKGAAIHAVNVYIKNQKNFNVFLNEEIVEGENDPEIDEPIGNPDDYKDSLDSGLTIGGKGSVEIINATTKSYALKVLRNGNEEKCYNMIIKNTAMPDGKVSVCETFGTAEDNQQTVEIIVYENDFMDEFFDVDDDYIVGTASLGLPGNLPANAPIEVTFSLNSEGILEVDGRDVTSNKEVHATMEVKGIISPEKVAEIAEKSKDIVIL
ncbi:Hsp70 family protein [Zhenpiania hominis]|uniref:Hsp70 family protein n=1 Tax=Zhenpiania hominis TaxID=2763644 RepID=UPI0039F5E233